MPAGSGFIDVDGHRVHYLGIGDESVGPPLVFLHEGLGSIELWRGFPADVVARSGHPGLVYSRYGHGWSDPLEEPRTVDYMHHEGLEVLPELVDALVSQPPILVGHSDGASIAIIYAGSGHPVAGLVLIAPHVFVEEAGLASIRAVRETFEGSEMADKMAKYHADPAATFYGWSDAWVSDEFRSWNLEEYLEGINCPVLLIQSEDDEYGTMRQLDAIEEGAAGPVERLVLPGTSHSPHLAHPDTVAEAVAAFITRLPFSRIESAL